MKKPVVVYSNGWRKKPYKYGRPFVRLEDYEKLKKEYENIQKQLKFCLEGDISGS